MRAFNYLVYRLFFFYLNIRKEHDVPIVATSVLVFALFFSNILTIYGLLVLNRVIDLWHISNLWVLLVCIVLLILFYSIISKKSFLEKGFKKTRLGTLLVLVYIFVTVTSCWYTLYLVRNMNVNHLSPSEVIGKYERAYESNSCYETLTLNSNSTYIHYYKNKKDGKVYNDTGKWEYLDSKNNKVRFYNWIFREKNDSTEEIYNMIYKTYVYERKEYVVLARGINDISNDFRKIRVLLLH